MIGLTTKEAAQLAKVKPRTLNENLCRYGSYHGIKPQKGINGRLYWPNDFADRLIQPKVPE